MKLEDYEIYNVISEQGVFQFTGRINIVSRSSSQLFGAIIMKDGKLINSVYKKKEGIKSIFSLFVDEKTSDLRFIVEPEVVDDFKINIPYPNNKVFFFIQDQLEQYEKTVKLRPPENLSIFINYEFIESDSLLSRDEFRLICTILDKSKVSEIYSSSELLDYEITMAFVSLRKKGALIVK